MLTDVFHNLWGHTQTGTPFVYAPYVYWNMGAFRNVTPVVLNTKQNIIRVTNGTHDTITVIVQTHLSLRGCAYHGGRAVLTWIILNLFRTVDLVDLVVNLPEMGQFHCSQINNKIRTLHGSMNPRQTRNNQKLHYLCFTK